MERAPRKKEKRPVRKGALLLAVLGLCLALGAAVYFLRPGETAAPYPEPAEKKALLSRPLADIEALEISPLEGESYRLEQGDNGFFLSGRPGLALQAEETEEMGVMAAEMTAEHTVAEAAEEKDLKAYGLDAPRVRVTVRYRDGEEKRVELGNLSPQETPQRYVRIAGEPGVYTVLEAECSIFFLEKDMLRAFSQPKIDASLLDGIRVEGEKTLALRRAGNAWQMEAPFAYPAADDRVEALLNRIGSMAFEACLGDAAETDLAAYGLDAPALTVTLLQAATVIRGETAEGEQVEFPVPETEYTLQLGNETGKSGVYLLWKGQVFRASNFLLGFWKTLDAETLLLRQPVNFPVNALDALTLTLPGKESAYRVTLDEIITENNQIARDEYGRVLYECAVSRLPGGESVEQEAFLNWYAALASLRAAGRLPEGFVPEGEPEARLTLTGDGRTRRIDLYPWDGLHDALAVDGEAVFYVSREWLSTAESMP